MRTLFLMVVGCWGLCGSAEGADNPHVWQPKVKSVAVFKNGYGFFLRDGDVKLRDGWCATAEIPPAVFSTLAVFAHAETDTVDVLGSGPGESVDFDGRDAAKDIGAKRIRLEAAKGQRVSLIYDYRGTERTAAGTVASVGGEFVVVEHDGNNSAVPLDGLKRLQVLDLPLRIHVNRGEAADKANEKPVKLGMAYLRKGITWIPEYTVKILDETTAEISLRGTLVNEAEDLIHSDVQFVVGVPNFLHAEFLEPIALGQVIRTIGSAVVPDGLQGQIGNRAAITNNLRQAPQFDNGRVVDVPVAPPGGDVRAVAGNLPQLDAGGAGSDFTVYTKTDLTVRRGEKAVVTLFRKKVKYSHRYRWELPAGLTHSLVLANDTDSPFTTGPFLAVSGNQPLSQDLLKYTPKGGSCELPVTAAVNVATDEKEGEIDRKIKALTDEHQGKRFDLVTLSGELRVRNFEKRPITVSIRQTVPGKPLSASEMGTLTANAKKLILTEREGTIQWTLTIPAGESKSVEYRYERYVPSP